jgi:type I restriction enzyme R subunit
LDDASKIIVDAQTDDDIEGSVDKIIVNDDLKKRFLLLAANVDRLYRAILPDRSATDFSAERALFVVMADKIRSFSDDPDISHVMDALNDLLDRSVSAQPYVIRKGRQPIDLSQIDFDKLQKRFARGHQRIEIERLRALIERQLDQMVRFNPGRLNLVDRFQRLIDDYNAGSRNTEVFFKELIDFARQLNDEEKRHVALGLSEEELAIFDLLTKPEPKLTKKEEQQVKKVAHDMLDALKREKLVLDWRKRQQSRAIVRLAIEEMLDQLPERYSRELYQQKCEVVYQHVYDAYVDAGQNVYASKPTIDARL